MRAACTEWVAKDNLFCQCVYQLVDHHLRIAEFKVIRGSLTTFATAIQHGQYVNWPCCDLSTFNIKQDNVNAPQAQTPLVLEQKNTPKPHKERHHSHMPAASPKNVNTVRADHVTDSRARADRSLCVISDSRNHSRFYKRARPQTV